MEKYIIKTSQNFYNLNPTKVYVVDQTKYIFTQPLAVKENQKMKI